MFENGWMLLLNATLLNAIPMKHNMYSNFNYRQQFRLSKINKIKYYFVSEIRERELMNRRHSEYISSFYYFDKFLIILSAISGSISIP